MFIRWLEDKGHDWLKVRTWRPSQGPAVVFPVGPLAAYVIANAEDDKRVCRRFAIAAIAGFLASTVAPMSLFGFRALVAPDVVLFTVAVIASLITIASVVISLPRLPRDTSVAAYFEWQEVEKTRERKTQSAIMAAVFLFLLGTAANLPRAFLYVGLGGTAFFIVNAAQLTIALRLRNKEQSLELSDPAAQLRT